MTYYNRLSQIYRTLKAISISKYINDTEIIIVDDASVETSLLLSNMVKTSFKDLNINLITIHPEQRKWCNPCVPYNIGFSKVTGNIVIIQNAECMHVGDILEHAVLNLSDNNYLTYGCYSIDKIMTEKLGSIFENGVFVPSKIRSTIEPLKKCTSLGVNSCGWYNHPKWRDVGYHFCSAITFNNLKRLGGFDERYQNGYQWDDTEFLLRIKRMGLNVKILDDSSPIVLHQWHITERIKINFYEKNAINKNLFYNVSSKEDTFRTNSNYFIVEEPANV